MRINRLMLALAPILVGACDDSGDSDGGSGGAAAVGVGTGGQPGAVGSVGGSSPLGSGGAANTGGMSAGGSPASGGASGGSGAAPGGGTTSGGSGSGASGGTSSGGTEGAGVGGGTGTGGTGTGGTASGGGTGGSGEELSEDPMPWFSFFQPSMGNWLKLAPDTENGYGGDLGGLEGADDLCTRIAQIGNPGDTKTWRAFLSAVSGPDGEPVNAIDRIGSGPWYSYNERLFAEDIAGLAQDGDEGRPVGADAQLAEMFTDEYGDPVSPDTNTVDNHDTLTGSDDDGRLPEGATLADTCNDWTSTDESLNKPIIGHAWPRSANNGRNWISEHDAGGCGIGISTVKEAGNGTATVGANGGYGAVFCFALSETD